MVKEYMKGYRAERSLTHELARLGFMVIRAPRSGRIGLASPDVIAVKAGRVLVFECKSRKNGFKMVPEQIDQLTEWEAKGGAKPYIAWKTDRKGWIFLNLNDVKNNNGNIGIKFAKSCGFGIEKIVADCN